MKATMSRTSHLLERWLHGVQALDLEGLVGLYTDRAIVESPQETWTGRHEIADGLLASRRLLKGMQVESVVPISATRDAVAFETQVKGRLGRTRILHHWRLEGQQIHGHTLEVLRHDKRAA